MILRSYRPDSYRDEVPLQKLVLVFKMLLMQSCLQNGRYDDRCMPSFVSSRNFLFLLLLVSCPEIGLQNHSAKTDE